METVGEWIGNLGAGTMFAGWIWFLVVAFKQEVPWGVACMIIPCVWIVFLVKYWEKASRQFAVQVGGFLILNFGAFLNTRAGGG
ncbi:MAG TPA: hypothetical protein VMV10_16345 [Pirellulales bacterium]|nr:hypothetical protein [Pirellulales bacterium]